MVGDAVGVAVLVGVHGRGVLVLVAVGVLVRVGVTVEVGVAVVVGVLVTVAVGVGVLTWETALIGQIPLNIRVTSKLP